VALVLQLRAGEDFFVQDERIVVEEVRSPSEFTVRRIRDNKVFVVKEGVSTALFKGVLVSVGARGQLGFARVALEAPRQIPILRGENYRRGKP
jgi:hypothetical protein